MVKGNTNTDVNEATACLRVLAEVAKADGRITGDEWATLSAAVAMIPDSKGLQAYVVESVDLDRVLGEITSPAAREQLWQSAYTMVYADKTPTREERAIVDRIGRAFGIDEVKVSTTRRLMEETKDTLLPSNIAPIRDSDRRDKAIDQDVVKYSVMSAVLGAFPVPGVAIATDLAIVTIQVKLVRDIGQYWDHKVDKEAAKTLLGGLGVGTGARIAVSNIAKLVPGWGSAFGATSAFATTWALGRITNRYFERGQPENVEELRADMRAMEKEGKVEYAHQQSVIESKREATRARLASLNEQRRAGTLSQSDYEQQVAALAD